MPKCPCTSVEHGIGIRLTNGFRWANRGRKVWFALRIPAVQAPCLLAVLRVSQWARIGLKVSGSRQCENPGIGATRESPRTKILVQSEGQDQLFRGSFPSILNPSGKRRPPYFSQLDLRYVWCWACAGGRLGLGRALSFFDLFAG